MAFFIGSLPTNWEDYLRNDSNKQDLFKFLAESIIELCNSYHVVTNVGDSCRSSTGSFTNLGGVSCTHMEEADGRIIMHVKDMILNGAKSVLIRCADTDILVLAISFFPQFKRLGLENLWLLYSCSKNLRYIPVHCIVEVLGDRKSEALRGFHAFSGCDTVSFLSSKGKRSAWKTWTEDATSAFHAISFPCDKLEDDVQRELEKFVVRLYNVQSTNDLTIARKHLFATENRPLTVIPPTRAALHEHTLRAAYQAGHIWGRADQIYQNDLPSPITWGWMDVAGKWVPVWSKKAHLWEACRSLDSCGCNTQCETMRCSCKKNELPCTIACKNCKGECSNMR